MSLRHERDSTIQKLFTKHNLGPLPNMPLNNEVALNLTNRAKTRLLDLEKDLQDKKVNFTLIFLEDSTLVSSFLIGVSLLKCCITESFIFVGFYFFCFV